jgi:hypothetical protein
MNIFTLIEVFQTPVAQSLKTQLKPPWAHSDGEDIKSC